MATPAKMNFSTALKSAPFQDRLKQAIPDPKKRNKFQTAVITAVANNPQMRDCTPQSIFSAALIGGELDLTPSPQMGQYYLVKYGDKATFMLGYRGMLQLALRSGQYRRLNVLTVKEGELVSWNPLTEEIELNVVTDPVLREQLAPAGYVASFEYVNGFRKTIYWTQAQMEAHAQKYSRDYQRNGKDSAFWGQNFEAMAHKTMLRQLISKWGVMSTELQTAIEADVEVPVEQPAQAPEPVQAEVVEAQAVSIDDL